MQFPQCELPKLRHLTFNVLAFSSKSLLGLSCMMEASTFLQKFTLKVNIFSIAHKLKSLHRQNACCLKLRVNCLGFYPA